MYDQMYVEAHLADLHREMEAQKLLRSWRLLNAREKAFKASTPVRHRFPDQSQHPLRAED
jgi:hypothetical protein